MIDYRNQLIETILPFWLEHAVDWEHGGIFTSLDEVGEIYGREKSVWFQGRALWTFSKAYNVIEQNPKYLQAAKCIYNFLPKCTDVDGRMFFSVTEDGRCTRKRRYYYSETFAAIGCAEYYRASGDVQALHAARAYFDVAYECFTGVRATEPKFNPETCSSKALCPSMIILSTAQTLRAIDTEMSEQYGRIAAACLHEILHGGYLTDRGLLESVSCDGQMLDTPTGRTVNPGHSMEAAWFVMLEGLLSDDQEAIAAGKRIIDVTLPLGWDERHGGIIAFTDVFGKPPVQLEWDMKLWWPQCETIIAARLAYSIFGEEKYQRLWRDTEAYCEKYFIDHKNGEWYGYLHYDNSVSHTLKGNLFKGPFHIPRLYMIMAVLESGATMTHYVEGGIGV